MYVDREDAAKKLLKLLKDEALPNPRVLALPRGGVPLGRIRADGLGCPLEVVLVRKIGMPMHAELAAGEIVDGNPPEIVFNRAILRQAGVTEADLHETIEQKKAEIADRRRRYGLPDTPASLKGCTAILVDDGIATGATARAALKGLRAMQPDKIVLAVPVAPPDSLKELRPLADQVICPLVPADFYAVGAHYQHFEQVSDETVIALLKGD